MQVRMKQYLMSAISYITASIFQLRFMVRYAHKLKYLFETRIQLSDMNVDCAVGLDGRMGFELTGCCRTQIDSWFEYGDFLCIEVAVVAGMLRLATKMVCLFYEIDTNVI